MAKRVCDKCGKEKDLLGGKTCEKGHFLCKQCAVEFGVFTTHEQKSCPICNKPLR